MHFLSDLGSTDMETDRANYCPIYWEAQLSNLPLLGQCATTIINKLKKPDGTITSIGSEILDVLHSFYTKLYARAPADEAARSSFWNKIKLPQISPNQAESLTTPITVEEVRNAIKSLKNNKAPGPDGLANEFYKILSPKIDMTLAAVFNTFLDGSTLPLYFNSALLKVLHKAGRDPELPASYRPIALLNSDYKLYTKILAECLKSILTNIVHPDQTDFIQGRHSVTNVRKVLPAMQ